MKRTVTITLAAVFLAVAGSAPATAQAGPPIQLQSDIRVHQKVRENGVERDIIAEPKVVVPGDRLVFRTTYRNLGKERGVLEDRYVGHRSVCRRDQWQWDGGIISARIAAIRAHS